MREPYPGWYDDVSKLEQKYPRRGEAKWLAFVGMLFLAAGLLIPMPFALGWGLYHLGRGVDSYWRTGETSGRQWPSNFAFASWLLALLTPMLILYVAVVVLGLRFPLTYLSYLFVMLGGSYLIASLLRNLLLSRLRAG